MAEVIYQAGDIVGVRANQSIFKNPASWFLRRFIAPKTSLFHFFVIYSYIPEFDDYTIVESLMDSGIRLGRLSWYEQDDYIVYRLNIPDVKEKGEFACRMVSIYGRKGYDWKLIFKLLGGAVRAGIKMLWHRKFRKLRCSDLEYNKDDAFICTELANTISWWMEAPIVPAGVPPLPPAFAEAYFASKIKEIHHHRGEGSHVRG